MRDALLLGMTQDILETLRANFGTVSSQTDRSGIVAVRNATAYKRLVALVGSRATINRVTANGFPALVRVTETED